MNGRLLAWLAMAAVAVALVLHVRDLRDRLKASRILQTVEVVSVQLASAGRLPAPLLWRQIRLLEEAEDLDPAEARLALARGSQYLLLERPEEAIAAYEVSLAVEPRPETYLNLGRAQLALEREAEARESFAKAAILDPSLRRQIPRRLRPPRRPR